MMKKFGFLISVFAFFSFLPSCMKIVDQDIAYTPFSPNYYRGSKLIFPGVADTSFFFIDTRAISKYLLFSYSPKNKEWRAISKGEELFDHSMKGNYVHLENAMETKNNEILLFSNEHVLYSYSLEMNLWNKLPVVFQPHYDYSDSSQSYPNSFVFSLIFNPYTKELFCNYNQYLFFLNESYTWESVCEIDNTCAFGEFISADTLIYFNWIEGNAIDTIYKLNITDHSSSIICLDTRDTVKFPMNALYITKGGETFGLGSPKGIDYNTGENLWIYYSNDQYLLPIRLIDFATGTLTALAPLPNDITTFRNPLDYYDPRNPGYTPFFSWQCRILKDDLYLFRGDVGFRYSFADETWEKLPYLDYQFFDKQ